MTERLTDPKIVEQQEQQHAERNRSAVRRALQHARHEKPLETSEPSQKLPNTGPKPQSVGKFLERLAAPSATAQRSARLGKWSQNRESSV